MEFLKRLDRGWARFEGWITVMVLLLMVLTAGFQAFVRNLTRFDVQWASRMLVDMDWADSLLRKGTLWLAFLGASLATYAQKHIGIDVILRIVPARAKYIMLTLSGIIAGFITFGLVYSFSEAVSLNLAERPIEYEMLGDNGSIHVCDATAAQLATLDGFDYPGIFCAFRSFLDLFGIHSETPGAAFQLIVPAMFIVMAIRMIAGGIGAAMIVAAGPAAIEAAEAEERAREAASNEAVAKLKDGAL